MRSILTFTAFTALLLQACGQGPKQVDQKEEVKRIVPTLPKVAKTYQLSDFLGTDKQLETDVNALFNELDDTAIVAQLLMPAVGRLGETHATITSYIDKRIIGGVLMLNGSKSEFTNWISGFEAKNKTLGNPGFLYSADAEPSLFNRKITGTPKVKRANEMVTEAEVKAYADTIAQQLKEIGINYNFAPVVDMSPNRTVGFRSFGAVPANIIPYSNAFIHSMQAQGIIGTAKHFPGHGLVSGDTHKDLQVIDGELKEIGNYPKLIADGLLSIMIGHLAVKNNPKYDTKGAPSTTSRVIITDLLRKEFGFNGLIVTDAMNMGGVLKTTNPNVAAIEAGCDIVLMPINTPKTHASILAKYRSDANFKAQVDASAKRILRMKLCVGAITNK